MARTSPEIEIQEIDGDLYADLHTAQKSARVVLAADLADIMRHLIETGLLEIKDGHIQPREQE